VVCRTVVVRRAGATAHGQLKTRWRSRSPQKDERFGTRAQQNVSGLKPPR
jgi:hypothetical protein